MEFHQFENYDPKYPLLCQIQILLIYWYKEEYKKLVEEYNWTSLVYESTYSFQPLVGEAYYLYQKKDKSLFLSLISPDEWDMEYLGTFKLITNGKWEKIN